MAENNHQDQPRNYRVIMKVLTGPAAGVLTASDFRDEAHLNEVMSSTLQDGSNRPMTEIYEVVAKNLTLEEVSDILYTPANDQIIIDALTRQADAAIEKAEEELEKIGDPTNPEIKAVRQKVIDAKRDVDAVTGRGLDIK